MSRDGEALLNQALRVQPGVIAIAGTRIGTVLKGVYPCVRLTLVGGASPPVAETRSPSVQWEAWADSEAQAALLADAIDSVADKLAGTYASGVIVASWPQGHYFHSRDPQTARERYLGQIGLIVQ